MKRSPLVRKFYRLRRSKLKTKTTRSLLLKDCDGLFRQIILRERINKCEWCGKIKGLSVSHILTKAMHPRLRYFKANVLLLCVGCHIFRWHKAPLEAAEFMLKTRGEGYREKLLVYDIALPKLTNHTLNIYICSFKQELNLINSVQSNASSQSLHKPD